MKYKYLKNLFICSSVFQVFNTINLCGFEFGFEYSDIILVDYGTNISTYLNLNFLRSFTTRFPKNLLPSGNDGS